ncbi:MAG: single-stranded DNA-binding protein [Acholeplasmataceae bacterium]
MINRVILVGRITRDPELKTTQSNIPVVSFTLAVNRQFTNQDGEREADFIQCVVWRRQAENVATYVKKGSLLGIDGRIQTRKYESERGTVFVTEVVCDSVQFLEPKGETGTYTSRPLRDDPDTTEKEPSEDDEFYETDKKLAAEEDLPF